MAYGPPSWRKLTGGLVAIALIFGGAIAIIAFARVGSLKGKTYTAYILATDASGIFKGTAVWLQGQTVGIVKNVTFRSLPTDTVVQTVLEMELLSPYQSFIRRDSRVEFKPGGTYIGAQVVALSIGSPAAPELRQGDTLTRVQVIDPEFRSNELATAGRDFPEIVGSLRAIGNDLSRTQTRIGGIHDHSSGLQLLTKTVASFQKQSDHTKGTLWLLMRDSALTDQAALVLARADSLLRVARAPGTLNRAGSDSALRRALADTRTQLDTIRLRIAREDGAAGRFLHDDALGRDLEEIERQLVRTLHNLGKYPERYSPF